MGLYKLDTPCPLHTQLSSFLFSLVHVYLNSSKISNLLRNLNIDLKVSLNSYSNIFLGEENNYKNMYQESN